MHTVGVDQGIVLVRRDTRHLLILAILEDPGEQSVSRMLDAGKNIDQGILEFHGRSHYCLQDVSCW